MSQYTIQVDQFLLNTLQPEIDRLTISMLNMEKYSYNNASVIATKSKLNKIMPVYDFLNEYAKGNEEIEMKDLKEIMSIAGLSSIDLSATDSSNLGIRPKQSVATSLINDFVRVYVDGQIVTSDVWWSSQPVTLDVFVPTYINRMDVTLTLESTSMAHTDKNGVGSKTNHVRFDDVILSSSDEIISLKVQGYISLNSMVPDLEETRIIKIINESCTETAMEAYYVGATTNAYGLPEDLNTRTDISIKPVLSGDDIVSEFDPGEIPVDIGDEFTIEARAADGDVHVILAYSISELELVDAYEEIFSQRANLIEDVHYGFTDVLIKGQPYKVVYLRSLSAVNYNLSPSITRKINFVLKNIGG